LPHVFFWDFARIVQAFISGAAALDWKGALDYLEEQMTSGGPEVREVIVTSFLWYMPYPEQPGHGLAQELGPVMSGRLLEMRG
jgi:hypothetical protein